MSLWELFVIAVGLSMDAFAVSICKGLSVGKCKVKHMLICGLYFGAFQAIMPSIGYLLGAQFETLVTSVAPYIAFALLTLIGFNMIRESCSKEEEEEATRIFPGIPCYRWLSPQALTRLPSAFPSPFFR